MTAKYKECKALRLQEKSLIDKKYRNLKTYRYGADETFKTRDEALNHAQTVAVQLKAMYIGHKYLIKDVRVKLI